MSPSSIHQAAAHGFAADADAYSRGRPGYPAGLVDWLRDEVGLASGRRVADVGAGTGKFVPLLRETGATVVAVEPVDAMRARLVAAYPDVEARSGMADRLPFDDAVLDAIVCAQAFHWFASSGTMREFARVLKPGGRLALVWNVRDDSVPWVRRMTDIMRPHEGDVPRSASGAWRSAFPADDFGPLVERSFVHAHVGSPQNVVVDRILSVSFIAALPDEEREQVATQLRRLVDDEPTLAGRDTVSMPYRTDAFVARRLQ